MADKENVQEEQKRFFYGPDEVTKYYIEPPTAEDIRGADWQYSKTYTMCLVEGITTSAEMMDILTRRGIIGPEFEQRASELAENLAELIGQLDDATDMDSKRELSLKVAQAREELFQWNQRLNGPMNNTAEQMSDDARLEYLTSCMIVDEVGDRIWDSHETYLKERSQALALRSRFEIMLYLQGLDSDFLDQTPEAKAMKEVEIDVLNKAQEAIKAAEAVKQEETEKTVEEKPKKRKVTRKKSPKKDESK